MIKYQDVTAMRIAREKKIIERAAESAPVWDSGMAGKLKKHPRNTDTQPPPDQDKTPQSQYVE